MAPVIEPKRRVKSIRKPGEHIPKVRKPRPTTHFSRAYINKLLKKVLKRRANMHDPVPVIYKTFRRMIKMACEVVARQHRKITLKEAHIAMGQMIPKELAMNAIREFRAQALGLREPEIATKRPADA